MTIEILIFLILIGIVIVLFTLDVLPIDVTALAFLVVLLATGYLNIEEAISGFSNKAVMTIAVMFVLSQALVKTGFLEVVADRLSKVGNKNQLFGLAVFLVTVSIFSAFINNTAAVAIFIPLAIQLSQKWGKSPSKVLIPLSFAAIYGGTMTLIGTSTNLLVSSIIMDYQIDPLGMFEFTAMGLIFMTVGTVYNTWIVPKILPSRAGISSLTRSYHLAPYLTEFKVSDGSYLIGPAPGVDGLYVATGCAAIGIAGSAAVGRWLAKWLIDGYPGEDLTHFGHERFGNRSADREWLRRESEQFYANYYSIRATE